jgi:hypothetical protein
MPKRPANRVPAKVTPTVNTSTYKTVKKKKTCTVIQARATILDSDSSESSGDVETESDSDANSHDSDPDPSPSSTSTSVTGAAGVWSHNVALMDSTFKSNETPGPRAAAANCTADTIALEYFALFWDDDIWQLIVDKTNLNALHVETAKPADQAYYARVWQP